MSEFDDDDDNIVDLGAKREQLKRQLETGDIPRAADEREDILKEMNEKHAYIVSYGGKPAVTMYVYNNVYQKEVLEFHTTESIQTTYSNKVVQEGKNQIELGKWWVKHAERREYKSVFFDPSKGKEDNGCLNLWEGITTQPVKGEWKVVIKHIYKVLCNCDQIKFEYTMKWMAWLMQNPGSRPEVAIIFKGKEGAGKGFIFTQLTKVFGEHGMNISSREHLTGKFNSHLARTVFLFADEAYYPGDKDVEGILKQLISEERMPTEAKFRDVGLSKNFLHIAMSTNQDWVIPAHEDSRRYFINEVDNQYAKNQTTDAKRKSYFDTLWGCMSNGGREAMVYDLLRMDLTNWHPRDSMPDTDEMHRQVYLSLRPEKRVALTFIDEGVLPGTTNTTGEYKATSSRLQDYLDKLEPTCNKMSMKKRMQVFKTLGVERRREAKGMFWVFPSLDEMKKNWEKTNGKYPWECGGEWQLQDLNY